MKLPVRRAFSPFFLIPATAALALGAPLGAAPNPGAAGDYPMVLGEPFTVDGVTYAPADTINYDKVGHAAAAPAEGGSAVISGAHRTLPLPSYVEVTSLQTGRTILLRLDRRGPMSGDALIELSPAAAVQLGGLEQGRLPVRVRRVNPPEAERSVLRMGQPAPLRLETPPGLLAALNRKLAAQLAPPAPAPVLPEALPTPEPAPTPSSPPTAAPTVAPTGTPQPARPSVPEAKPAGDPKPAPVPAASPKPAPKPAMPPATRPKPPAKPAAAKGVFVVQIAAFSTRERADAAAVKVAGTVVPSGKLWRLQLGPFTDRGKAEAALAKARAAGYTDARIQRAD